MNGQSQRIIYASPPIRVSMADSWYDIAALDHFWIRRRFDVLRSLADPLIRKASEIAEIGCGNGLVQKQIEDYYGKSVTGFDLNDFALQKNVSQKSQLYCYDIHQRYAQFRAHFDAMLLLDVLEHIDDEAGFLQSIRHHMTASGSLVINVPAHQAFYSKYDAEAGHVRRYSIAQLASALERNRFRIRSLTYWGLPLIPLLVARKAMLALRRTDQGIIASGFDPGGPALNYCLGLLARCEALPQKWFGTSLLAVAENQPDA